jgi:hypothetical protein
LANVDEDSLRSSVISPAQSAAVVREISNGAKLASALNSACVVLNYCPEAVGRSAQLQNLDSDSHNSLAIVALHCFLAWAALSEESKGLQHASALLSGLWLARNSEHSDLAQDAFVAVTECVLASAPEDSALPDVSLVAAAFIEYRSIQFIESVIVRLIDRGLRPDDAYLSQVLASACFVARTAPEVFTQDGAGLEIDPGTLPSSSVMLTL